MKKKRIIRYILSQASRISGVNVMERNWREVQLTHAQNQSDSVGSFDRPGVDIVVHQTAYPRALVMLLVLLRFPPRSFVL